MGNNYIFPVLLQVFERQAAMAVLRRRFAAQEDGLFAEAVRGENRLDLS